MGRETMRRFWDARARERALYFVDNRLDYRDPDEARFWESGELALDGMLARLSVEVGPGDEVLEIGCGVGRITRVLARRAAAVKALDVSAGMLERARALNPGLTNVEWILGDGTGLGQIAEASVDACHSDVVFQHVPDPAITLGYVREIGRVLRPGGWAAIAVSDDPSVHRASRAPRGPSHWWAVARRRRPRGQAHPAWLGSAVDLGELRRTAEAAGLAVERLAGEGTQYCHVLLRRRAAGSR